LSSEKYPALRSSGVGPAISNWIAKVSTCGVGEMRTTGNTAERLVSVSGKREKYTLSG
jgi:hypothetical protein